MARATINIGNTTEETVKVDEINPLPVEETEPAENTEKVNSFRSVEISITTWAEEAGEATKLEYYASDIEKCTVEKVAVVAKGEAAKDFKICTYTGMKKYLRCDKCGKYLSLIPALLNQFTGATRAPGGGWWGGRGDLKPKNLFIDQNTDKSVSPIRAAEIFISTSSKDADGAINLPQFPIILIVLKSSSVVNATKHNITTYAGEALT